MIEAYNDRALLTDLYELTMAAAYFEHDIRDRASFELFVRQLPPERNYLVAAGLDSVLGYLEALRFNESDIKYLSSLPVFRKVKPEFFAYLRSFRFTGDVHAVEEGTLMFAGEPMLQVTAPVLEAQIVETYLLSVANFETLIASKAARIVSAAKGRAVWEFGTRRAHGPQAGVRAARAAYVGGCEGTSNVLAGFLYGVPLAGTAAHSWTQVFPTERESFDALLETFPETTLLIDTYDTLAGAETVAALGRRVRGVRIDSGDLLEKSRKVRDILDQNGVSETKIFASGDLNEYRIQELIAQGAPIDAFGVGTDLATSRDVPALGVVYKLVEVERDGQVEYKTKFSEQKAYWPGRKQVFRFSREAEAGSDERVFHHDVVARADEQYPEAAPLLKLMMSGGKRIGGRPALAELRARTLASLECLPQEYQGLHGCPCYPVENSPALVQLREDLRKQYVSSSDEPKAAEVETPNGYAERLVFLDVDTQVDFMSSEGSLAVPGAEKIVPQLKRLMDYARSHKVPVISTADAHAVDDPSFAEWPPHCVMGTPGQQRIPETQFQPSTVIPNRPHAFRAPQSWTGQFILEKTAYSVAENPNFDALLEVLGPAHFVAFGVATEYCVRASVLALRARGLLVDLVTDAIQGINLNDARAAIEDMANGGTRLVTTEEVCALGISVEAAVPGAKR
jgi:nicotinate phosphoribosyltransferase